MGPRIISASRRTDIPAFYAPWFMSRVRAGFCVYPNPLYPHKLHRASLRPEDVLGIVFWTRHALPLIPYLSELEAAGYPYYFQYTVVGYPPSIDGRTPPLDTAIRSVHALADRIGRDRIVWRYDPVILSRTFSAEWHREVFRRIADALVGAASRLVVSVIDPYPRARRRLESEDADVSYRPDDYAGILQWMAAEASARGLAIQSCAEPSLGAVGITPGRCVDGTLLAAAGSATERRFRRHGLRAGCLCHQSVDIGATDSCGFGCLYCYATTDHERALETVRRHQADWTCITRDVQADTAPAV